MKILLNYLSLFLVLSLVNCSDDSSDTSELDQETKIQDFVEESLEGFDNLSIDSDKLNGSWSLNRIIKNAQEVTLNECKLKTAYIYNENRAGFFTFPEIDGQCNDLTQSEWTIQLIGNSISYESTVANEQFIHQIRQLDSNTMILVQVSTNNSESLSVEVLFFDRVN